LSLQPNANDEDVWLRAITNANHLRQGKIHRSQLKHWLSPPDDKAKPWKLELSGRLLSLLQSISSDADRRLHAQKEKLARDGKAVPSDLRYCGIVHAEVLEIRGCTTCRFDVVPDQNDDDDAHTNIVVVDKGEDEILTVAEALADILKWLSPEKLGEHPVFSSKA
jgi:hypothetical protein